MGVVATNVLKEVWKEYSDEFKVQENFNNENTLVLQEQVKMELENESIEKLTNYWPDATLPVGWQNGRLTINNSSETFKIETLTI